MVLRSLDTFLRNSLKIKIDFLKRIYNADSQRAKVFINYHHNHVREWVEWIKKQNNEVQSRGFAKLIEHLKEHPRTWNKITIDVLIAISYFRYPESIPLLKNFIITAHRMCDNYSILSEAYIPAIKGLILNDESVARDIIDQQINVDRNKKEIMQLISTAIGLFTFDVDITNIVVHVITYPELSFKEREAIITSLGRKSADQLEEIFLRSVDKFIELDKKVENFSKDCLKVFALVLSKSVKLFNDAKFFTIEQLCTSNNLKLSAFEIIGNTLGENLINLDIENTYKFYAYANSAEEKKLVQKALAQRNALTYQELMVTRAYDLRETFPFTRKPLFVENITEKVRLPGDLDEFRSVVVDSLAPQIIQNENGDDVHGGGILLTGDAFWEKLYIGRSIAAEKKWKFIFIDYQYFLEEKDNEFFDELQTELLSSPHNLIFIENIHISKDDKNQILFEKLRKCATEVNIYYLGSIPKEVSINDSAIKADLKTYLPRDLFPAMRDVPYCTLEKQGKIWEKLLFGLGENRAKETVSDSEVLISSYDIYSIEFDVYIRTYLHICLLIYGKLVSLEDMQKIGVF
ncbi:MAG: hypothetical protein VKK32_00175 [Candidatus Melainabacteria bacterium]|nr:hypothetical protein [Candidatus Melainabacteria bacterium]